MKALDVLPSTTYAESDARITALIHERIGSPMSNEPIDQHKIDTDFPLLYAMSGEYDFAERLGGSTSALHAEVDAALREIHMARSGLPDLREALISMRRLASAADGGDPWYAEHEGIDAAAIYTEARWVLGEDIGEDTYNSLAPERQKAYDAIHEDESPTIYRCFRRRVT